MSRLERLSVLASVVRGDARVLWHALRQPGSPTWLKLGVLGIVAYVVSPVDFIPDVLPVLGVVDDLVLIPMAIGFLVRRLPAGLRAEARKRAGLPAEPGETVDMR